MSQTTSGIKAILSNPIVYEVLQNILSVPRMRRIFINDYVKPFPGAKILDLGCGPSRILDFIPDDVDYLGIDLSQSYIDDAQKRYGHRGRFRCMDVGDLEKTEERFDIAFSFGILHHIGDEVGSKAMAATHALLKPGGRYVTFDPCYVAHQFWFARKIADWDRGEAVRTPAQYEALGRTAFPQVSVDVRHDLWWLPVNVALMTCTKD